MHKSKLCYSVIMTTPTLLPCPFCGVIPTVRSNRDTHTLEGAHTDACFFDAEEDMGRWPATDEALQDLADRWNSRASQAQGNTPA